jgi:hypothetical protein
LSIAEITKRIIEYNPVGVGKNIKGIKESLIGRGKACLVSTRREKENK